MGNEVHLIFKDWDKDSVYYPNVKKVQSLLNDLLKEMPPNKLDGGIITIEPTIMKYDDISSKFVGYDIKVKESNLFTLYIPHKE